MPLNESIIEAVTANNVKTIGEGGSIATNNLYQATSQALAVQAQNLATSQMRFNGVLEAGATAAMDRLLHTKPVDAIAMSRLMSGNDQAMQMQALLSALASGQQGMKTAQSSPPETAVP